VRVALARGAAHDDVDDIVQEAMSRVAGMSDVDTTRIGSLLTVVVAHLVVDRHRGEVREARLRRQLLAAAMAPGPPPPDETVCDRDEARWLWARAVQLTEQDRAVLRLRAQGKSAAAAAAELGITLKAAENALARARQRLHAVWKSTVAVTALTWARLVRRQPSYANVVALAVASSLVFLAVPWWDYYGATSPSNVRPSSQSILRETAHRDWPASTAEGNAAAAHSRLRQAIGRRPTQSRPPDAVATGPIHAAGVATTGGHVRRRHGDETLEQTLERCVHKGVTVSPYKVGCNS
jgi:DNA-directed RNA polymerase specialized sigma24 family protein